MNITIEINGIQFEGFTNISITRHIESMASAFSFDATNIEPINFPLKRGDACKIFVNTIQVMDGFIEILKGNIADSEHILTVEGRDKTSIVIDSSISTDTQFKSNITFKDIIKQTLRKNGITGIDVIDNVGDIEKFTIKEIENAKEDQNIFEFLEKLARKKQVLLTTDGLGNIILERASTEVISTKLLLKQSNTENNNILTSSFISDETERYNKIIIRSQANISVTNSDKNEIVGFLGSASDINIRTGKTLVIVAEESLSGTKEATNRAIWEINVRKARGFSYNCIVQGFSFDNQDETQIWPINKLIDIVDDTWDINARLLIKSVEYRLNIRDDGSRTILNLTLENAYTVSTEESQIIVKNTRTGNDLIN